MPKNYYKTRRYRYSSNKKYLKKRKGQAVSSNWPSTALGIASKALATALMVKKLVNVERKYHSPSLNTTISSTGNVSGNLLNIPQGDGSGNRDGQSIRITSFQMKGTVKMNASATSSVVRLMLVADLRSENSTPNITDILETASPSSLISHIAAGQFLVLKDWRFALNDNGNQTKVINYYQKMDKVLKYAGGTTGAPENYNLVLVKVSDEATNVPTLDAHFRFRYIDN